MFYQDSSLSNTNCGIYIDDNFTGLKYWIIASIESTDYDQDFSLFDNIIRNVEGNEKLITEEFEFGEPLYSSSNSNEKVKLISLFGLFLFGIISLFLFNRYRITKN